MSRLFCIGAMCAAFALSLSVGPPGVFAGQGHQDREAVANSPGHAALVVEETAAPLQYGVQVVVQKSEVKLEVAVAKLVPLQVSTGGVAFGTTSVVAPVAAIEAQEAVVVEVAPHRLLQ